MIQVQIAPRNKAEALAYARRNYGVLLGFVANVQEKLDSFEKANDPTLELDILKQLRGLQNNIVITATTLDRYL